MVGAIVSGGAYAFTTNNFSLGGLFREAAIGAVVGGLTAAVPGAIAGGSLNFGGRVANTAVGLGNAAAVGSAGSLANQFLQCGPVDFGEALLSGGANTFGLGIGRALQSPARNLATTTIPARRGLPVTSLRGRTFMVGSRPARQFTNEVLQQTIQDLGGAAASTAINQLR